MSIDYFITLFIAFLAVLALLFIVFVPLLEGKWLKNWYASQGVDWLTEDGSVNSDLQKFISDRYVTLDQQDGSIKPRTCEAYAHPFLFTDLGKPLVVLVDDHAKLKSHKWLKFSDLTGLRLREFQTECVSSLNDWRELFVDTKDSYDSIPLSRLKRYQYNITFEEEQDKTDPNRIPTSAGEAFMLARAAPREQILTFVFTDKFSGQVWKFQLNEYVKSPFSSTENLTETSDLFERLPEYALDRSSVSKLKSTNAQSEILFMTGTGDSQLVEIGNPCWNKSLNKFQLGNFPITLVQFSNIYLRGLQHVSEKQLEASDQTIEIYRRLFWSCTFNPEVEPESSPLPVKRRRNNYKILADLDQETLQGNPTIKNVLLQLKICQEGEVFDVKSGNCIKSE